MVTDDESEDKEIDEVNQEESEQDEVDGTKKKSKTKTNKRQCPLSPVLVEEGSTET